MYMYTLIEHTLIIGDCNVYHTHLHVVLFAYSFIKKPNKGVKFLQERGLVGKEAKDVATFFYEDDRLDRVRMLQPKLY